MKPSDYLFQLIKSLSKSEKRYFKLSTQFQKGDKLYMSIISIMEKMETYDEEELKRTLIHKNFKIDQLHVTKNYIYNLILKSLRSFHANKTVRNKLNTLLTDAKLLEQKGLYLQYNKKLKSAKTLSKKYEYHHITVEVLDREMLLNFGQKTKDLDNYIAKLQEEKESFIHLITIESEYKKLLHQVFTWYRTKNKIRDKTSLQELSSLLNNDLLEDASKATTFQSRISFFFSNALIHHIMGEDLYKANLYYKKVVEIWERYSHMKIENYKLYKIHLSNYLNSCHSIQKYTPFPEILEKVVQLPSNTFDEKAEEFQNVAHLKLLYQMNTFQYEQAIQFIPKIIAGIKKYKEKINKAREFSFYGNIAILYFAQENYEGAITWIDKILNYKANDHRKDVQLFARIMLLIIHYELKNHTLLESLYRSTYRGFKKLDTLHEFEKTILHLIKNIQNTPAKKEQMILIQHFHTDLIKMKQNDIQKKIIGLQEISIWAYSKIHGKNYLEVLKEQRIK